ncbi:MarR family winged helix-turn-helix transcriptional regulator [Gordonia sp. VNQ95]|jgi:DNA-binding MarR family transcriptional regulator|uniref:MarR family winged helix-turn-helix transcriptional regulator n=1 Tax=Gordonia sp. VNQ95 TaxID=3156619 RepID=UPI0032B4D2D8
MPPPAAGVTPTVPALVQILSTSAGPRLTRAFADAGLDNLRPGQALALTALVGGPVHASDIAGRLGISRQAVAQAVAALDRHGYLTRSTDPADARAKLVTLTDRGWAALRVMRSSALALEQQWRSLLGDERLADFADTLTTLISHSGRSGSDGSGSDGSEIQDQ